MVALGEVAHVERAGVDPRALDPDTPYLGLEHIERGGRIVGCGTVGTAELTSTKFSFTTEHVLFGKLRPYLGKIARPPFSGVCSTDILPIRPGEGLDRNYLVHYLRQPTVIGLAASQATGANLPRLSPRVLEAFEIPLPPLPEQRRIAAILDNADALRTKRRHTLALLDDLTKSVFHDMFGELTQWPIHKFGDVCETRLGKMLDAKQQTGEHQRPYLRNANVQWFRFDLDDVLSMDFDAKSRALLQLQPWDLLICEGGEPGRCAVWRGQIAECYYQKALHRARPNTRLAHPEFIAHQMWHLAHSGALSDYVTSATIAHLTGEKLKQLPLAVPPLPLQKEFATRVAAINAERTAAQRSLDTLDELFASLQSRAFSGQL